MDDMNQYTLPSDYCYSIPLQDANMLRADQSWITIDKSTTEKQIKKVQEQIDNLKNQMMYVLSEIENLKKPFYYESLL